MSDSVRDLRRLAAAYGVQTSYLDVALKKQEASPDTLRAVLLSMGAPLGSKGGAAAALAEREWRLWSRPLEPVLTAWDGKLKPIALRLPADRADVAIRLELRLESGEVRRGDYDLSKSTVLKAVSARNQAFVLKSVSFDEPLPPGYHSLRIGFKGRRSTVGAGLEALMISAASRSYAGEGDAAGRAWGLFAPLYSLHSEQSWGAGNFSDLERLWDYTSRLGGGMVATLPLLATFLDRWGDPSPYSPASRLFWNESYLDVNRIPELAGCPEAQSLIASPSFQAQLAALRGATHVNHMHKFALQRTVLAMLTERCLDAGGERLAALRQFVSGHPLVGEYARFRAIRETHGWNWPSWPEHLRSPRGDSPDAIDVFAKRPVAPGDYDDAARRYHIYAQFLAHEQIGRLVAKAQGAGSGLYLDLPLGVNRFGFDTWLDPQAYVLTASGGAPPDEFFTKGQNWGFSPLHPDYLRQSGYRPFLSFLRHHMASAGMLRIDHVMMLHRLYWVPEGLDAAQGAYVRYPADELFALLSLESHRCRCRLAGENLGTVPPQVNSALKKHRVRRMYVVQYEAQPNADEPLTSPPRLCVASLNTHDMPPFASWWEGREFADLADLGLFDEPGVKAAHRKRAQLRRAILKMLKRDGGFKKPPPNAQNEASPELHDALLGWLAASDAETVLVNLEDMWQETKPQNTPGTYDERPNWRRKAALSLEQIEGDKRLADRLAKVDALRKAD